MLTIFLRAIILYSIMIVVLRGMGKRQLACFQPFELAMTIVVADLIAAPMGEVSTPLLHGILPIAALFIMQGIMSVLCAKSDKARAIISGKPAVVIEKGVINQRELEKLCISVNDLIEGVREAGIMNVSNCGTAIMEADGIISAFPKSEFRPPVCGEMNIDAGYEGLPLVLIVEGRLQKANLSRTGRDAAWLEAKLRELGQTVEGAYFCQINTQGVMSVQPMSSGVVSVQAIEPGEVNW